MEYQRSCHRPSCHRLCYLLILPTTSWLKPLQCWNWSNTKCDIPYLQMQSVQHSVLKSRFRSPFIFKKWRIFFILFLFWKKDKRGIRKGIFQMVIKMWFNLFPMGFDTWEFGGVDIPRCWNFRVTSIIWSWQQKVQSHHMYNQVLNLHFLSGNIKRSKWPPNMADFWVPKEVLLLRFSTDL